MYVNVSLHDVTPFFKDEVAAIMDLIHNLGVTKGTILVVPEFHGRALLRPESGFTSWLRGLEQGGWEIVLHGLTHYEPVLQQRVSTKHPVVQYLVSRCYTDGEGEFYRLPGAAARVRIQNGLSVMAACGLAPAGFIAPAWLLSEESRAVLNEFDFSFTTTLSGVIDIRSGFFQRAPVVAFSSRSALRATLSRFVAPFLANRWAGQELVRLVLHPLDARRPAIMELIIKLCRRMLACRRPVTIGEYLAESGKERERQWMRGIE